jgi:uncharacterized protein YggU (UPF0235/DUF167 family)
MIIKARVEADAKSESISEVSPGSFIVSVREPAHDNLANTRVRELLAMHFSVRVQRIRLISGHQKPSKKFELMD